MKGTFFFVVAAFFVVQGFFLADIHKCMSDTDCPNGCCANSSSPLGLICQPYHLPLSYCDSATNGKGMDCGCQPGYSCQFGDVGNIAVEPNTHLKGSCLPTGDSASGPQIAIEGGR